MDVESESSAMDRQVEELPVQKTQESARVAQGGDLDSASSASEGGDVQTEQRRDYHRWN